MSVPQRRRSRLVNFLIVSGYGALTALALALAVYEGWWSISIAIIVAATVYIVVTWRRWVREQEALGAAQAAANEARIARLAAQWERRAEEVARRAVCEGPTYQLPVLAGVAAANDGGTVYSPRSHPFEDFRMLRMYADLAENTGDLKRAM